MAPQKKSLSRPNTLGGKLTARPTVFLIALLLVSTVVHYLLSISSVHIPTVYIDEGLYVNIARSIFFDGRVLYRGQPVSYVYLLYPFFLLPLFLLPASVSLYRAIQLYNALLISTSVFPAYLLGRKMGLKRERSCLLAALTVLVPEMALSSFLTAESIYYPLMMWQFVLAASICKETDLKKKTTERFGLGLLTGITFFAKPVCVIFGACFLLVDMVLSFKKHEKKDGWLDLGAIALTGLTVAAGYALYHLAYGSATVMNLYEKQFDDTTAASIPIMLQSVVWHVFGLIVAFGGACVLLPGFFRKDYPDEDRKLMLGGAVGILATVIGVAVMVVPYKFDVMGIKSPVHLRYLMFFAPLVIVFTLSSSLKLKKPGKGLTAFLVICAVLTAVEAIFGFINMKSGTFNAPSLNMFYTDRIGNVWGIVMAALSVLFTLVVAAGSGWKKNYVRNFCLVLAIFFAVNTCLTCAARKTRPRETEENATRVAEAASEYDDTVIITGNIYDDYRSFILDGHMRKTKQTVVLNDLLLNVIETGGVYHPWVPVVQSPNIYNEPMYDTETLLFDYDTPRYLEFTDSVRTEQYGEFVLAHITRGQPFLKTALGSVEGDTLYDADVGSLLVYDPEILARGSVTLIMQARCTSAPSCTITFSSCGQQVQAEVTNELQEYTVTLPMTTNGFYQFTIDATGNIQIPCYRTE